MAFQSDLNYLQSISSDRKINFVVIYCNNWSILNVIFCHLFLLLKTHPHVVFYQHIPYWIFANLVFLTCCSWEYQNLSARYKTCISVCGMTSWYSKEAQNHFVNAITRRDMRIYTWVLPPLCYCKNASWIWHKKCFFLLSYTNAYNIK